MASSVSGQDESNPALWLATRVGKMELSCPLGTTRRVRQGKFPQQRYNKSFIDQVWGQDGWILALFFFCEFMNLDPVSVHKHAKKELGQYPAILTSHLVNNPYVLLITFSLNHQVNWSPVQWKNYLMLIQICFYWNDWLSNGNEN